jgi:hypothetical protein
MVNSKCFTKKSDARATFAEIQEEIDRIWHMFDIWSLSSNLIETGICNKLLSTLEGLLQIKQAEQLPLFLITMFIQIEHKQDTR